MTVIGPALLCGFLLAVTPTTVVQTELLAVQEVLKQLDEEIAEIEKKVDGDVKKQLDKTTTELKKIQDEFCKQAKLDEAVAVRDFIRRVRADPNNITSTDLPPAAREVTKVYEDEVAAINKKAEAEVKKRVEKAATELKKIQDEFCKQAKLDEAVSVRDAIRSIRTGVSKADPDPGYVNNQAADIGKVFYYDVVGVDKGESIYGSDIYTTGSHLGMAAVHCGVLKAKQRGIVKVTILPGQNNYLATTRHGITSYAYGPWGVSFKVERSYRGLGRVLQNALPDPGTLTDHRADVGKSLLFEVIGSNTGSVWGAGIYTDDSNLATAAVHAGILAVGQKGIVKVTILPGQASYASSTSNGITSSSWGQWTGSFQVERVR